VGASLNGDPQFAEEFAFDALGKEYGVLGVGALFVVLIRDLARRQWAPAHR
jgi:hypothetical protein